MANKDFKYFGFRFIVGSPIDKWLQKQDNQIFSLSLMAKMMQKEFGNVDLCKAITDKNIAKVKFVDGKFVYENNQPTIPIDKKTKNKTPLVQYKQKSFRMDDKDFISWVDHQKINKTRSIYISINLMIKSFGYHDLSQILSPSNTDILASGIDSEDPEESANLSMPINKAKSTKAKPKAKKVAKPKNDAPKTDADTNSNKSESQIMDEISNNLKNADINNLNQSIKNLDL